MLSFGLLAVAVWSGAAEEDRRVVGPRITVLSLLAGTLAGTEPVRRVSSPKGDTGLLILRVRSSEKPGMGGGPEPCVLSGMMRVRSSFSIVLWFGLFFVEFVDEMVETVLAGFVESSLLDFLSDMNQKNQNRSHEQSQPGGIKSSSE